MDQTVDNASPYRIIVLISLLCLAVVFPGCTSLLPAPLPTPTSVETSQIEYVGRVVDENTGNPIEGAKVTFEFEGAPPVVYTDSEGVYRFTINFEENKVSGRVRVEADGYEKYDRNITLFSEISNIDDIRLQPSEPLPTSTSAPTQTPSLSQSKSPTPSSEPVQPTFTPTSRPATPTPVPKTSDDTMKLLGEGYSANGVSLTLQDYSIGSSDINLEFVVKNESSSQTTIRYQNSYFEVYDDTGRQYEHDVSCEYDTKQQQFEPGETDNLYDGGGCYFGEIGDFEGVISEDASHLVVKVSEFMDLRDMQWRIDLTPPVSSEQSPSPGEMISLGEGFSANGLTLILSEYSIGSSDINLEFVVKNEANGRMLVRYQNSYFQLYDDLGNQYERDASCLEDTKQQHFEPGETDNLYDGGGCYFGEIGDFEGVINEDATHLIVKVSKFMDLRDMQWRIDLTPPVSSEQSPPPGKMVSLGEGFSANGLTLILSEYSIGSSDINLEFVVKNEANGRMLVRYQNSYFQLYDDLGNQYERDASCLEDTKQQHFEPGETDNLYDGGGCYFGEIGDFEGVISEDASHLVVKVSEFMDLRDLHWRIDL